MISYVKVSDSPGLRIRSSKPRSTILGSVGPPREMYCFLLESEMNRRGQEKGEGEEGEGQDIQVEQSQSLLRNRCL